MIDTDEAVRDIRAFNRFYTNVIGVVDRRILDSPYSLTEARILFEISSAPDATARRIRNVLKIDEGYLSRTIDSLRARGLVVKERSAADKRNIHLRLSEKGMAEFRLLDGQSSESTAALLSGLSAEEIETLIASMREIARILGKGAGS
jgi:DNA-binding MarR family transcriptional regulator